MERLDDPVQRQYTDYPYPPFTEADIQAEEQHYMKRDTVRYHSEVVALETLNHYLFGGRQDFKNGFRILIAGKPCINSLRFLILK